MVDVCRLWRHRRSTLACRQSTVADKGDTDVRAIASLPKAALPIPRIAEVRKAAKSFKWYTGQGADKLAPRSLSLLSDATLSLLVQARRRPRLSPG